MEWHPYYDWLGNPITQDEWQRLFADKRHLEETDVGTVRVSTVYMGLNHQWTPGAPPHIFETMIFGGEHDEWAWRYSTEREARDGHAAAVSLVRAELGAPGAS